MTMTRREALAAGALGLGLSALAPARLLASPTPKRLLILGGTGFIGPHTVSTAVKRGHQVTIFTRGRRQVDLPEGVERLVGDRNDDHSALEGREWDVVFDNNCYDYRWAQKSTALLKDAAQHYLFISSLSSYRMPMPDAVNAAQPLTEKLPLDAPLVEVPADFRDGDEADYALMKILSERIVQEAFPGRSTIVRPTLIVGPGDHTGRWSYWPVRMAAGGEMLAPGNPKHSTQVIDQRDLTEWTVHLAEQGTAGVFNAAGPDHYLTMGAMLDQVGQGVASDAQLTWVAEDFLTEHGVQPWSDMPAWVPNFPMMYVDVGASVAAGLRYRPIATTARDTLAFEQARDPSDERFKPFPFTREREQAVLKAWHQRTAS